MCGGFLNRLPAAEIARILGTKNALSNYSARFSIAPTNPVLVVRFNPKTKERSLGALRWGLVPHWAKDLKIDTRTINARRETVATMPAFRDAFEARRCPAPAIGFYEWKRGDRTKTPYVIMPSDAPLFAFAGLWENWRDRAAGAGAERIRTRTIITCPSNELGAPVDGRMPVVLPPEAWANWLGEEEADRNELQSLLEPCPAERMRAHEISTRVNRVETDDARLVEPVTMSGARAG